MLNKVLKASSYTKSWYVFDARTILVDYVGYFLYINHVFAIFGTTILAKTFCYEILKQLNLEI